MHINLSYVSRVAFKALALRRSLRRIAKPLFCEFFRDPCCLQACNDENSEPAERHEGVECISHVRTPPLSGKVNQEKIAVQNCKSIASLPIPIKKQTVRCRKIPSEWGR